MKKQYSIYCLVFAIIPSLSFAQRDSNKVKLASCVSINAGIGIPIEMADYGDSYYTFANTGLFLNAYATIPLNNGRWGVAGMFGYTSNTYTRVTYSFDKNYYNGINVTSLNTGKYYLVTAMPGIYFTIPCKNTAINFRLLAGLLYFETPQVIVTGDYNNYISVGLSPPAQAYAVAEQGTWFTASENCLAFVYDAGVSIKFKLAKRFFGMVNADILHSHLSDGFNPTTQFAGTISGNPEKARSPVFSYHQLSQVNLTLGVCFKL